MCPFSHRRGNASVRPRMIVQDSSDRAWWSDTLRTWVACAARCDRAPAVECIRGAPWRIFRPYTMVRLGRALHGGPAHLAETERPCCRSLETAEGMEKRGASLAVVGWSRRIGRYQARGRRSGVVSGRRIGVHGVWTGAVSERLKESHWKCGVRVTVPGVRIPPAPFGQEVGGPRASDSIEAPVGRGTGEPGRPMERGRPPEGLSFFIPPKSTRWPLVPPDHPA